MSDDHNSKSLQQNIEKAEKASHIYTETKKMLLSEERFINFFKPYHPKSIESFIESYAQQKSDWHEHADGFARLRASKNNHWWYLAVSSFIEIVLKKLFDVKCRWIAGEMDLPGIETSGHFYNLMNDLSLCNNIVEPVTEAEFNCYLSFLKSGLKPDDDDDDECGSAASAIGHYHWNKSVGIEKEEIEDEASFISPWFRYYDKQFGTGALLKLPLTRMDIELDYHDIWTQHIFSKTLSPEVLKTWSHLDRQQRMEMRNNPEKYQAYRKERVRNYEEQVKKMPKYEHIHVSDHYKMKELVALIEPPEVQKLYHAARRWTVKRQYNERIESDIIYLNEADETIPIRAHDDYREAIREAWREYSDKVLMETLPLVFEAYQISIKENKPFSWKTSAYELPYTRNAGINDHLLAARKWKGEPENFDFLKKENLPKAGT